MSPEPLFLGEEGFSLSTTMGSILRELETSESSGCPRLPE
jgi:hypothetical protein